MTHILPDTQAVWTSLRNVSQIQNWSPGVGGVRLRMAPTTSLLCRTSSYTDCPSFVHISLVLIIRRVAIFRQVLISF